MHRDQSTANSLTKHYLALKNILPRDLVEFLKVYYGILGDNRKFVHDGQCPSSLSLYGDPALDAVLEWLRPRISDLAGVPLTPTYSYTRVYTKGEVLGPHTDRSASEIALTICINIPDGGPPSTILLRLPGQGEQEIQMREGDGCLYVGTEIEHRRDAFKHDGYIQLFLFYIRTDGRYFPEHAYDKRQRLGEEQYQPVLTVNGISTSLRALSLYLKELQKVGADVTERLIDSLLVEAAVGDQAPTVTDSEIEEMLTQFRVNHCLLSGMATQCWLDEHQMTLSQLRAVMQQRVRAKKFRQTIVASRARLHFDSHRRDFDVLTVFRLDTPSAIDARRLAEAARSSGLWGALSNTSKRMMDRRGSYETRYRLDVPELCDASVHNVIGPNPSATGFWVGEVLSHRTARFDARTRVRIEALLFAEWLSDKRKKAKIEWHLA